MRTKASQPQCLRIYVWNALHTTVTILFIGNYKVIGRNTFKLSFFIVVGGGDVYLIYNDSKRMREILEIERIQSTSCHSKIFMQTIEQESGVCVCANGGKMCISIEIALVIY